MITSSNKMESLPQEIKDYIINFLNTYTRRLLSKSSFRPLSQCKTQIEDRLKENRYFAIGPCSTFLHESSIPFNTLLEYLPTGFMIMVILYDTNNYSHCYRYWMFMKDEHVRDYTKSTLNEVLEVAQDGGIILKFFSFLIYNG